jgi:hypothetical protein
MPCAAEAQEIHHIATQRLELLDDAGKLLHSLFHRREQRGRGCGSCCTPRQTHHPRQIGADSDRVRAPRPTGEICAELGTFYRTRLDLTRILWLSGCEIGFNRLGETDTMRRISTSTARRIQRNSAPSSMAASGCTTPT